MAITKEQYITRVLLIMNEAQMTDKENNFYIGADTAQIDRYIEGSYVDAWRRCVSVMPRTWFENKQMDTTASNVTFDSSSGTGYIILPSDFYLLSRFKMKGWLKPVFEASHDNERVSSIQSNEFTRGSTIRPVCVISSKFVDLNYKPVMYFYSLPKGTLTPAVEDAIYVPNAKSISDLPAAQSLNIDDRVLEPIAYLSASTVFTMFEKYDIAKALDQRVIEMFPALRTQKGNTITFKQ